MFSRLVFGIAFCLSLFSVQAFAVSAMHIYVGDIDAPLGKLKNADFQVDLKTTEPTLNLKAAAKPGNEKTFTPFSLHCAQFNTEKIGHIDCLNGSLIAKQVNVPFSLYFVAYPNDFSLNMSFDAANFSDDLGVHAGEKLTGKIKLAAKSVQDIWQWSGLISWDKGELFWQPFYFGKAGNQFEISGTFKPPMLNVENASLLVNGVGKMSASAQINTKTQALQHVKVSANNVDFAGLYAVFLKPMAEKSVFGNLDVSGKADWQFEIKNLEPSSFELNLREASIEDKNGKFAFRQMNAHLPWDYNLEKTLDIRYKEGHLLNMPLGFTKLSAVINRYSFTSPQLTLPILDGALNFNDVSAVMLDNDWYWHVNMNMTPISMSSFSKALGWPLMQGKISGKVPQITYANKQLVMNGAMIFNVFDGAISMDNLKIDDPLGVAPKLQANLLMRNLDLGEVTRTFSFGNIEGKLEGDVNNMLLENWKPVYLDASIQTGEGLHVKKISQRAVENITALGGEGTAAALQRTFLRFFKEFNYKKIGLSCKLRQDVCEMSGVKSTATGYVIVEGSGIPALNVNGYTQRISLSDLLGRIKRITDGNSKAVVQ